MSPSTGPTAPSALRQLGLLARLWWLHMRRRAMRLGDAPRQSGAPMFLVLNLFVAAYMATLVGSAVARSCKHDSNGILGHLLGIWALALGSGIAKGASTLQVRGTRNDSFLEPLPLKLAARLGLQLADSFFLVPMVLAVPLAALSMRGPLGGGAIVPSLQAIAAFVALYVIGQAVIAWARALGPPSTQRIGGYVGLGLYMLGMIAAFSPLGKWLRRAAERVSLGPWLERVARAALDGGQLGGAGIVVALLAMGAAYRVLAGAERWGFDRLAAQAAAPKVERSGADRLTLEWRMMMRAGGRALLLLFGAMLVSTTWFLVGKPLLDPRARRPDAAETTMMLQWIVGIAVYLGAIQTIGQAGRAARSDLQARAFLAALPLSPHQVLDGKVQALRRLLVPVLLAIGVCGGVAAWQHDLAVALRAGLSMVALYVVAVGAVSVSFLSTGVGVAGVGGGQASSGFSTQLLMIPLLATAMAPSAWSAFTACLAVVAVSREARRAAQLSVRWIDDPADDAQRETTVWRALLAATAFFSLQGLSAQLLGFFELPPGYRLATVFAIASVVLALLTWRNAGRFARPRLMPTKLWGWPAGVLAGAASGTAALGMVRWWAPSPGAEAVATVPSTGELVALAITLTLVAPLVEEYFFRGWLQKAIEEDLPASHRRWAFALGAVAFALAHIGTYGVPQLVVGLLAGALFAATGGLWPAILVHAVHNGIVLLGGGA